MTQMAVAAFPKRNSECTSNFFMFPTFSNAECLALEIQEQREYSQVIYPAVMPEVVKLLNEVVIPQLVINSQNMSRNYSVISRNELKKMGMKFILSITNDKFEIKINTTDKESCENTDAVWTLQNDKKEFCLKYPTFKQLIKQVFLEESGINVEVGWPRFVGNGVEVCDCKCYFC